MTLGRASIFITTAVYSMSMVPVSPPILRGYQRRIAQAALAKNTIVLLPTGAGKTYIAAEVILQRGGRAIMFVPKIPLVEQQAKALRSRPGMPIVGEYHGGRAFPTNFSVLVTTPKAFDVLQSKRNDERLEWQQFQTVIFDECHHVIKDHPYRNLVFKLKLSGQQPRIIGLTASLTFSVGAPQIKKSIMRICEEMDIDCIEHASDEEMVADGYTGAKRAAVAEVRLPHQRLNPRILPQSKRRPHLLHETFFKRVDANQATNFSLDLVMLIREMETEAKNHTTFISPLSSKAIKSWGVCAKRMAGEHPCFASLEHWYEALRILIVSWEEAEDAVLLFLEMMKQNYLVGSIDWSPRILSLNSDFFHRNTSSDSFLRFNNLVHELKRETDARAEAFRGIVFVRQRVMVHIIAYFIQERSDLKEIVRPCCFYSVHSPATPSLKLSKSELEDSLEDFEYGFTNLLVTTNVAEEGLDIPDANCVIYFDSIDHAVSYVQGRGRARQDNSSFVMLSERRDRPAALLAEQEAEQHLVASTFDPSKRTTRVDSRHSQQQRERGAARYLMNPNSLTALANLNIFCKKAKVTLLEESHAPDHCKMKYKSILRCVVVEGKGNGKKAARKAAAMAMIRELTASMQHVE